MNFVILTHNNDKVFPLLDSLVGQKVWIVDDESDRAYVERMRAHPSKPSIHMRRLLLDFSAQRNHILQFLPQDAWICMIDSDEQLDFDPNELVKCSEVNWAAPSIWMDRYNWITDGEGRRSLFNTEIHYRCYRNSDNFWKNPIHEEPPQRQAGFHFKGNISHEKTMDYWSEQSRFYDLFKRKILLTYCVTDSVREDFLRAQALQPTLPPNVKQLVIANAQMELPPHIDCVWNNEVGDGESFNLATQRNLAINYAIEKQYDWLFILDCDSIIIDIKKLPESGYGTAKIWMQQEGEPFSAVDWNEKERWDEYSWFVLGRELFSKSWCRFDEAYKGSYHQDWDFHEHVIYRNGIARTESDVRAVHLWHPRRSDARPDNHERFEKKRAEYRAAVEAGFA